MTPKVVHSSPDLPRPGQTSCGQVGQRASAEVLRWPSALAAAALKRQASLTQGQAAAIYAPVRRCAGCPAAGSKRGSSLRAHPRVA